MAFNVQTFRTRALTAVVFVAVMMVGLLWNTWAFFILFSIVHFGAWMEYQKLVGIISPDYKNIGALHRWALPVAGWCLLLFFTNQELYIGNVRFTDVGFWAGLLGVFLLPVVMVMDRRLPIHKTLAYSVFGLVYISLSLGLLIGLRTGFAIDTDAMRSGYNPSTDGNSYDGKAVTLTLIFSIWINDTMAYIVGSFIGKTPFSKISPKKTWEGTVGGAILCVAAMAFIGKALGLSYVDAGMIAALAAVFGTLGDLFESKLKRMAGVKDSGSFMPGHGGFLDRFDSLLFASVVVWLYVAMAMG